MVARCSVKAVIVPMRDSGPSVLQRKAGAGRAEPAFGVVSPARALRLALSKAAQDVLRAPLAALQIAETRMVLAEIATAVPEEAMAVLLHGPGPARGLVVLDGDVLAAVLQALTLGRISDQPPEARLPTATDAMLARRFLTVFLQALAAALAGHSAASWATGFTPRERVEDLRRLPHLLKDVAYRLMSLEVEIAGGLRQGRMWLLLPWDGTSEREDARVSLETEGPDWSAALEGLVMDSPAALDAVLFRVQMTLSEVAALRPGSLLAMPLRVLAEVSLEAGSGEQVAQARLGQVEGNRAVRLSAVETAPLRRDPGGRDFRSAREAGSGGSPAQASPGSTALRVVRGVVPGRDP